MGGGGMSPICPKERLLVRADDVPLEFVRAMGAECWERVLDRWAGTSIWSYLSLERGQGSGPDWESYRGEMPGHGGSTGGYASRHITATLLVLLVDRRPVVLEGGRGSSRTEEGCNLGLSLRLLGKELLEPLEVVGTSVHACQV